MITVREAAPADHEAWLVLRLALWPHGSRAEHEAEMEHYLRDPGLAVFLAFDSGSGSEPCGFAEACLRSHAEDCSTSPVGFLEGIYVAPDQRHLGVGRALVAAVEQWAAAQGCFEMASNCLYDNQESITFHRRLGFEVLETLVHFRRPIPPSAG